MHDAPFPHIALIAAPAADLTGTYTGSLVLNDRDHGGAFVIKGEAGKITVFGGPTASKISPAANLKVDGEHLTFDLTPPGSTSGPWKCDVVVNNGRLTGTVVMPEAGDIAKVDMRRALALAGTYAGSLTLEMPEGEQQMPATIVVKQEGEQLTIHAGPDAGEQMAASNIKLDGTRLTFELSPPRAGIPWQFDLIAEPERLSGRVKASRGEEKRNGKLDLKKQ